MQELPLDSLKAELEGTSASPLRSGPLLFAVDVGASNCRFGLAPQNSKSLYVRFVKVPANSIPELLEQFARFEAGVGPAVCARIAGSALNIPGPVNGTVAGPIANYKANNNEERKLHLHMLPKALFHPHHSVMLNDLEAGAYGIIATTSFDNLFSQLFSQLWTNTQNSAVNPPGTPKSIQKGNCLVLAPGTGLGAALIQYHPVTDKYTVLPLEFGHTSVQSHTDQDFLAAYRKDLKRGEYEVEYDDICSGRGLERLYRFLVESRKGGATSAKQSAQQISLLAKAGDATALDAFTLYNKFLMRMASQMCMGFVLSSIVVCGDNAVVNKFIYENGAEVERMRATLLDHSAERMGFMSRVDVVRQAQFVNLNLLGCVHVGATFAKKASKL